MKISNQTFWLYLLQSLLVMIIIEVVLSTFFPMLGLSSIRFSINIFLVLFLTLFIQSNLIPFSILIIHFIHSVFSTEGWAIGSLTAIIVAMVVFFTKDWINFKSRISLMLVFLAGNILWSLILGVIISLKLADTSLIMSYFLQGLGSGVVLALFSPILVKIFDKIWGLKRSAIGIA